MTRPLNFYADGAHAAQPPREGGSFEIRNCRMVGAARISLSFDGPTAVVDFHGATVTGAGQRAGFVSPLGALADVGHLVHAPQAELELERVRDLARGAQREAWELRKELVAAQARVAIGTAAGDVLLERERHPLIGWTPEHDRAHGVGHLVDLAVRRLAEDPAVGPRGDLVEAAALLLAAIDVIDSARQPSAPAEEPNRG